MSWISGFTNFRALVPTIPSFLLLFWKYTNFLKWIIKSSLEQSHKWRQFTPIRKTRTSFGKYIGEKFIFTFYFAGAIFKIHSIISSAKEILLPAHCPFRNDLARMLFIFPKITNNTSEKWWKEEKCLKITKKKWFAKLNSKARS